MANTQNLSYISSQFESQLLEITENYKLIFTAAIDEIILNKQQNFESVVTDSVRQLITKIQLADADSVRNSILSFIDDSTKPGRGYDIEKLLLQNLLSKIIS